MLAERTQFKARPACRRRIFRRFQSIAKIQELILQRASVHVVDGPAHVANQSFEFEAVHRDNLDVRTCLAGLQGVFNLFERISVSKEKRSSSGVS